MQFINLVADEARRMNHHPTWTNSYNKVSISFFHHDAGNKITDLDIQMAKKIAEMLQTI